MGLKNNPVTYKCVNCGAQASFFMEKCFQCGKSPTKKLKTKFQKLRVPSKLSALRRAEQNYSMFSDRINNFDSYSKKLTSYNPKISTANAYKSLEKKRAQIFAKYSDERKKTAQYLTAVPAADGIYRYQDYARYANYSQRLAAIISALRKEECPTLEGVTKSRCLVPEVYIETKDDNDTESNYVGTFYDSPGGFLSFMFDHWLLDKTHWYSFDSLDLEWVISHYGFDFPAPECDGVCNYTADISLLVSAYINAESSGLLLVDLLLEEQQIKGAAPDGYDGYSKHLLQQRFTSTNYKSEGLIVTGSFDVKAGEQSRLWFGISTLVSALEGQAGTNQWSYLMIKRPPGESQYGIKYQIS